MLAWRSLPGADVDHAGSVWFMDAPGGQGTVVKVELQYNPPAGIIGAALASLWGEEPGQQIEEDLLRLKQYLETGVVTPSSTRTKPIREQKKRDQMVELASEESFPASDAPAYSL
jgi:uncharacterized membrane protein